MRKLASIRKIDEILPIPNADAIEVAVIGGWNVVVKKGEFKPGQECVYFEIDSFLPDGNPAWQFLVDKQSTTFEGRKGHRLRTIKLRGQLSQGFIVSIEALSHVRVTLDEWTYDFNFVMWDEGEDVTDHLGIVKWEAAIPAELAGQVEGAFPTFIPKTDQERCQNIVPLIFESNEDSEYEVSMKLDGTSCTIYHNNGKFGVCSRNWELKINDANANNSLVRIAHDTLLNVELPRLGNYAIQGELMGPGIQGNREGLKKHELFVFDVYDIDKQRYLTPKERRAFISNIQNITFNGAGKLWHVPLLEKDGCSWTLDAGIVGNCKHFKLRDLGILNIKDLLSAAEGLSLNHKIREGLVFKRDDGAFSFKAIANNFLLKEE